MNDIKETWYKWDYVCLNCDSLIEMTIKVNGKPHISTCPACLVDPVNMTLVSVVDATIDPTTKEEKMETTELSTPYNPNLLVTYKKIAGTYAAPEAPEYITEKVTNIEWQLHQGRTSNDKNIEFNNKVFKLENVLTSYAQDADEETLELITEIANIFDISLTKEIEVTGTISFSATITVPLTEDYDIESICQDVISVTSYDGDTEVSDYSVEDVRESY